MATCTGCEHLAPLSGECQALIHKVICGPCLKTYPIADARCPKCDGWSGVPVSPLRIVDGEFQRNAYCPLSTAEQKRLDERQTRPAGRTMQKELF